MPWTETAPMNERMRFVTDWERDLYSMVELCERYGVSRKTGYKWLVRYEREGPDGLHERSRAPHHCPHRIAADVAAAICAGRRQHPSWGPEKILQWLKRHPEPEGNGFASRFLGDFSPSHPGILLIFLSRFWSERERVCGRVSEFWRGKPVIRPIG